jgi:hypothetical protein
MTGEALFRRSWWSLRVRFWMALVVVVAHALAVVLLYSRFGGAVRADWELSPGDRAALEATLGGTYGDYLLEGWAGGGLGGLLAILAVALAVGGVAAERRQDTADLTLSLPVSRSSWLLAQAGLCVALLFLLACLSATIVMVGGAVAGAAPPFATVASGAVLSGLGPAWAVGLALAATTLTRDGIGAAFLALLVLWLLDGSATLAAWQPGELLDVRAWAAGPPWRLILAAASVTSAFLLIAIRRFDRIEP